MASIPSQPGRRASALPEVQRPSSTVWQPLEAESIRWEGQVLIVGDGQDMPARLVVTGERLALINLGTIALDVPRDWLRPAPELAAENGIRLFISPDMGGDGPEPILLRARAGRGGAAELVAVLTGRHLPLQPESSTVHIPSWREKIGAAPPIALPALDEDAVDAPAAVNRPTWPPVEQDGVIARSKPRPQPQGRPMQAVADQRRANMPAPAPVPTATSRAARKQGTQADGLTIADDTPHTDVPSPPHRSRSHHIVAWTLRAAILLMLLGTVGYFGRDRIEASLGDLRDRIPANVQTSLGIADDDTPNDVAIAPDAGNTSGGDVDGGTNGPSNEDRANQPVAEPTETPVETKVAQIEPSEVPVQQTDPTANIGGPTGELPPTDDAETVNDDPTAPLEVAAPTEIPAEPTVAPEPTDIPIEPTAVPTEEPTVVPTVEPTAVPILEPTVEPTTAPTEEPTDVPTEEPTVEPTIAPTEEPTAESTTAPRETPTEEPEGTPEPTRVPQDASVAPETTPEQAVVSDGFRYTVEGASVGETVPEVPEINSVGGYGEWVVLSMYGQNMSTEAQVFDMSSFRLYADGQEVLVDVGNAWVSGLLGNTPAYGNTDAIQWAPGESHRFTLTFLAPSAAQSLVLQVGDQSFDLSPALTEPEPLLSEQAPVESDLIQAKVVDVIDAETIVVEIDGGQQTVRYLSIDVPTGDACYAAEATAANQSLVTGQTVTLERQATNVDARGNWVRDVWVTNDAGQPVLVSQQLVLAGAAEADISVPNTRFAGWLESAEATAQDAGAGLWSSCGE